MFAVRSNLVRAMGLRFVATPAVNANATYIDTYAGTTSATLGAHQVGDIFIAWAIRDTSSTSPTMPAGWTLIEAGGANTLGCRMCYKIAATTGETTGTFTNATTLQVVHLRPTSGWSPAVGATVTSASSSATNLSCPGLTLQNADNTSWVFAFFGHRSDDISGLSTAPAGMVLCDVEQDASDSSAVYRVDGATSSWTTQTTAYGGTASAARWYVIEIKFSYGVPVNVPTNLAANVTGNTIDLTWTDTNTGQAQHRIDVSSDGTNWALLTTVDAGTNAYQITGASAGTTYYRIRAQIGASTSSYTSSVSATVAGGGAGWQLSTGHWIPRKFNMRIVHPRPDAETGASAQHRNAYPGLPWTTYIDVVGGAYPFQFELIGAPAGMTIGQQLTQSGDVLVPAADYGRITWNSPVAGTYNITINVYDQDYNRGASPSSVASVTFALVVSTSRFVFIDPVSGNDGNAGTLAAPFQSINKLHAGSSSTSTYNGKNVYLRGGTHDFDGMATNGNRYAMVSGGAPNIFIGYPGESAIIEMYQGHCAVNTGGADMMFKDLQIQSAGDWTDDQYFFVVVSPTNRHSWHNVTFTDFYGGTGTESNNQAAIYYSNTDCNDVSVSRCTFTGRMGCILDTYKVQYLCFTHNTGSGLVTTAEQNGANQWCLVYLKDSTRVASIRANTFVSSMGSVIHPSFVGVGGQNSSPAADYAFNQIEYCYNKLADFAEASIRDVYEYASGPVGSVYGYRNSCLGEVSNWFNNPGTTNLWENNVIVPGFGTMYSSTQTNNTSGVGTLDTSANLSGSTRTNYLGIRGAEIV